MTWTVRGALEAAAVIAAAVAFLMYGCAERRAGAATMQLEHVERLAKDADVARAASSKAMAALRDDAVAAKHRADVAAAAVAAVRERLVVVGAQRDRARAALTRAASPADSVASLLQKSVADDSLIADQQRVIDGQARRIGELEASRVALATALATADAQRDRDAATLAELRAALRVSRPPGRLRQWSERALWLAAGIGIGKVM